MDYQLSHQPKRSLDEIHEEIQAVLRSAYKAMKDKNPTELLILSAASEEIPMLLGDFGWYLANVESDMDEAKDARDAHLEKEALTHMKNEDPDTGKSYTATKAEKMVTGTKDYQRFNQDYRDLVRAFRVIKLKYSSVGKSFDGMRSRLGVLKRDFEGGI